MGLIRLLIILAIAFFVLRYLSQLAGGPVFDLFSSTKRCSRCDGKGWWQNTRNRDKCEWCQGSGRLPKKFQA